uniref:kelch-like protein 24 isoform X2 n=1 Tax=Ciona intestinalis TaxID=7719 RepID=UPI00089DACB3|nr:kelch-like protein 24 isoform X2 [Ciona intestinalis]|eukprot:XP_018666867.1 kelch-like protein 24 isoform X2 [Ciona intestinalis]
MDMSLQVSGSSSPETCTFKLSIKSYAEERPLEICNYEDVFQLKVKETVFHVHRQVLEAASGYFKGLCNSKNTTEGRNQEVKLNDVDVEVLKTLIHFMYTGNVKITEENVWGLLQWSDYFDNAFGAENLKYNTEEGRLKIEFKNVGDSRVTRVTKTLCGEPLPEWSNIEESQR